MTEPNKRENISEELSRSQRALAEANLLRALLLSRGLEPKSHEGALRLFAREFVKKGVFTSDSSHVLSRLMKYREEADYNPYCELQPVQVRPHSENSFRCIKFPFIST